MTSKQKLNSILNEIESKQKTLSSCHDYYLSLEQELNKKKEHLDNPEDYEELEQTLGVLNKEYDEKIDHLCKDLNAELLHGLDLSVDIGDKVQHDFKKLWDYMTNSKGQEVDFKRVCRDIKHIKSLM